MQLPDAILDPLVLAPIGGAALVVGAWLGLGGRRRWAGRLALVATFVLAVGLGLYPGFAGLGGRQIGLRLVLPAVLVLCAGAVGWRLGRGWLRLTR